MSGKSRRRGRRLSRSQRRRISQQVAAPIAPAAQKPTLAAKTAAPVAARAPAAKMAVQAVPPDVAGELKRIGVVGGLMIVLLVAAYFVVPLFLS